MPRPRTFDMHNVLEAAARVYWKNGYAATVTEELEKATGLMRGSLYNAFGDKRGLYIAAIKHYCEMETGASLSAVKSARDFPEGVEALFRLALENAAATEETNIGCLVCDAAVERAPHDPEIAEMVRAGLDELHETLAQKLAAEETGLSDAECRKIADQIAASFTGMKVLMRAGFPHSYLMGIVTQSVDVANDCIRKQLA